MRQDFVSTHLVMHCGSYQPSPLYDRPLGLNPNSRSSCTNIYSSVNFDARLIVAKVQDVLRHTGTFCVRALPHGGSAAMMCCNFITSARDSLCNPAQISEAGDTHSQIQDLEFDFFSPFVCILRTLLLCGRLLFMG